MMEEGLLSKAWEYLGLHHDQLITALVSLFTPELLFGIALAVGAGLVLHLAFNTVWKMRRNFRLREHSAKRGRRKEMPRASKAVRDRRIADRLGDTLLEMAARDELTAEDYYEAYRTVARAFNISEMMPRASQRAFKAELKRRRAARLDPKTVEVKKYRPGIDDPPEEKEQNGKKTFAERFKIKTAA